MRKNEKLLLEKLVEKWMLTSQKEFKKETNSFIKHYYSSKQKPSNRQAKLGRGNKVVEYWWFKVKG